MEKRFTNEKVSVETREDGTRFISGYAAVFYKEGETGTEYQLWKDLKERIKKGAFKRAIKEKDDVRALLNHDPNFLLSRVGSGLVLKEDERGLHYEFPVDETDQDHIKVVSKIAKHWLSGSSFAFIPEKRIFIEGSETEPDIIEIQSVRLYDVSPVTYPAYEATEVGLRMDMSNSDMEILRKEYDDWKASKRKDRETLASMQRVVNEAINTL